MASRVNAASQPKTTTAQATPVASVRPSPCTRPAPQVTTSAAATMLDRGRVPSSSGPITASTRRDAGHGHAEDGGFGVPGALDQGQVEHHQAGHGDTGQPQPLRTARPAQPPAGHPGQRDEQQAGHAVPDRFGGEHRRPGEHRGDRDAAAHADHGRGPAPATASPRDARAAGGAAAGGGGGRRGGGRGAAGVDAGTSGARRPGTTLRYEPDGPANRANGDMTL